VAHIFFSTIHYDTMSHVESEIMATMAETNPWVFQFPRSSQYIDDLPSKITPGSTSHVSKNIIWWSYPSASRVSQNIIWPKSMSSLTCDITIYHIWHIVSILVGGLEHGYHFSMYWECHHPNWRTPSFFRGVGIPPTRFPRMTLISHLAHLRWGL
jgi:hypothetical protein